MNKGIHCSEYRFPSSSRVFKIGTVYGGENESKNNISRYGLDNYGLGAVNDLSGIVRLFVVYKDFDTIHHDDPTEYMLNKIIRQMTI